ncbi:penicillin-binding protein 2 [bacterium]|nr:penicillin-binding protein 2 [bacterium]
MAGIRSIGNWQRSWTFYLAAGLLFGLLVYRLAHLQLLFGSELRGRSESNRIRLVEISPVRGAMLDRNGRLLVSNRPASTLYGVPSEMEKDSVAFAQIARILGYDVETFRENISKTGRYPFLPQRLQRDLSFECLSKIEEQRDALPGIFLQVEPKRYYLTDIAAHVYGYVAEVSPEELSYFPDRKAGDLVGKRGLERTYDKFLRGKKGHRLAIVNVFGQEVGEVKESRRQAPVPGKDLHLTLDYELQALAESLLVGKLGAIVAIEPSTGEVLAMASSPTYKPDIFSGAVATSDWRKLLSDSTRPMLNRAMQAMYPPGSTLKMAILLEGLESGEIDSNWSVYCHGSLRVGDRSFACWSKSGHGRAGIYGAIERSCDVFFYTLGLKIGPDGIYRAMTRFNLGEKTGIDIGGEASGNAPSEDYYNRRYGKDGWTRGYVPSISIGQGEDLTTPLQMCAYIAAIADGKFWRQPHLVREIEDNDTGEILVPDNTFEKPIEALPVYIQQVREGTRRVIMGTSGTARFLRDDKLPMGGKTGTAQNPHGEDHAWFVCFAPYDDPQIAVCVLIEFGEHGSSGAAPLANKIVRRYLETQAWPFGPIAMGVASDVN